MIIVSQDRNTIVNFDNIAHIFITKSADNRFYSIMYGNMSSASEGLGYYQTEQRAKEVLDEIIKAITGAVESVTTDTILNKIIEYKKDSSIFYMPKE